MKKLLALLVAASLCLALAACGGTGNPDHEYVLSLMERGDYDMAISVLEDLRARNGGASAETAPKETPLETTEATLASEATQAPQVIVGASQQQMVIDLVNRFMEEKGNALVEAYEHVTAEKAGDISVVHAMEYRLGNYDDNGGKAHSLMVFLSGDFAGEGWINDNVQIILDMDTQKLYVSTEIDWDKLGNMEGSFTDKDDFWNYMLNAYFSYVCYGADSVTRDSEYREDLCDSDLTVINEALK